jgi:hypothetical protein
MFGECAAVNEGGITCVSHCHFNREAFGDGCCWCKNSRSRVRIPMICRFDYCTKAVGEFGQWCTNRARFAVISVQIPDDIW